MVNYARWNIVVTLLICVLGLVYAAPNFFGASDDSGFDDTPAFVPSKKVNLGLDRLLRLIDADGA